MNKQKRTSVERICVLGIYSLSLSLFLSLSLCFFLSPRFRCPFLSRVARALSLSLPVRAYLVNRSVRARHHDLPEIPKNKSQCPCIFSIQTHYIQDFVFRVEARYKPDPGQDGGAEQSHCVVVYDIELNTQIFFFFGLEARWETSTRALLWLISRTV